MCVLSHFSCVQLFVTLWPVAHQGPLSIGFFRQEYWSGLPRPPSGDHPNPWIKPASLVSPALAGGYHEHHLESPFMVSADIKSLCCTLETNIMYASYISICNRGF